VSVTFFVVSDDTSKVVSEHDTLAAAEEHADALCSAGEGPFRFTHTGNEPTTTQAIACGGCSGALVRVLVDGGPVWAHTAATGGVCSILSR
jgi:hypothetical protein